MDRETKFCPYCGEEILERAILCKHCRSRLDRPDRSSVREILGSIEDHSLRAYMGLAGAFMLSVGTFCPIAKVPFIGSINYFYNGKGDGVILLILAGLSFYWALQQRFKFLWYTGLASASMLLFTLINFNIRLSVASKGLDGESELVKGMADIAMASVGISWGYFVLCLGAGLLMSASLVRRRLAFHDE